MSKNDSSVVYEHSFIVYPCVQVEDVVRHEQHRSEHSEFSSHQPLKRKLVDYVYGDVEDKHDCPHQLSQIPG